MKRIISVITAVFFAASGFLQGTSAREIFNKGSIVGYGDSISVVGRATPDFYVDENGDFTVLQVTDSHIINGMTINDTRLLLSIAEELDTYDPDLVVATGDIIEGSNSNPLYNKLSAIRAIAKLFEKEKQYWAFVPGNNDGEYLGTAKDVAAVLAQYDYCIISNEADLSGSTQYTVDLKNAENKTLHSLVFLDSLQRDAEGKMISIKADQVNWLAATLAAKKALNPDVKVSLFFHVSSPAFNKAAESGVAYKDGYNPISTELWNDIPGNAAADDAMKNSGCVSLVSIGHVHPSTNWCSFYDNTYYHITRASRFYIGGNKPGCSLITIHTAAASNKSLYDFTDILYNY